MAERPPKDVLSLDPPIGADCGSRTIGHALVGEDVVDRRAFLAEQLAELPEGKQGGGCRRRGRRFRGPPGPGGYQSAFCVLLRSLAKAPGRVAHRWADGRGRPGVVACRTPDVRVLG